MQELTSSSRCGSCCWHNSSSSASGAVAGYTCFQWRKGDVLQQQKQQLLLPDWQQRLVELRRISGLLVAADGRKGYPAAADAVSSCCHIYKWRWAGSSGLSLHPASPAWRMLYASSKDVEVMNSLLGGAPRVYREAVFTVGCICPFLEGVAGRCSSL